MTANVSCTNDYNILDEMPTAELLAIAEGVLEGRRLTAEEGVHLFQTEHNAAVLRLADICRQIRVGEVVYFSSTQYIHPTNLCELSCPLCSYYAKPGWDSAWFMTPEDVEKQVRDHYHLGVTEVHVVGGLWRDCNLDYYEDIFSRVKQIDPSLHIKALTPVEYDFLATLHSLSVEEVFKRMIDWGLGSLPGGGAEVLVEKIRQKIAPQKIDSDRFLEIHSIAHRLGLPSNITMLFGSIEEVEDLVTHLIHVRELQDETGGFRNFVPLRYHEENNALGKRKKHLKPKNVERVYAVSRLLLDNIPNITALWNYLGIDTALKALQCGANHFGSTATDEKIIRMAGGVEVQMTHDTMTRLIEEINRVPLQAHSGYCSPVQAFAEK